MNPDHAMSKSAITVTDSATAAAKLENTPAAAGMPLSARSTWLGIKRGAVLRCPNCGKGHLFRRFLKIQERCEYCGVDNSIYPSDDAPPYLTLVLTGHVIVPLYMAIERAYAPPMWLSASIWLPLTAAMSILLLPYMKGGVVGFCWAKDIRREQAGR
jgi:uncharacterized protein (DUF983 family)